MAYNMTLVYFSMNLVYFTEVYIRWFKIKMHTEQSAKSRFANSNIFIFKMISFSSQNVVNFGENI